MSLLKKMITFISRKKLKEFIVIEILNCEIFFARS